MASAQNSPSLAVLDSSGEQGFVKPVKRINEGHDVSSFLVSRAYIDIMTFLMQLNRSMFPVASEPGAASLYETTQSMPADAELFSDTVRRLRSLLDELEKLIELNAPDPGPRRFGNVAFRKWIADVENSAPALLRTYVPLGDSYDNADRQRTPYVELESYLLGSFGSAQRLDYGTGHELSFLAFLGCIWKLGAFPTQSSTLEEQNIVLGVIEPYLQLVRRLIKTYTLEPAGSHGVWGLDDHSFLPYLFGSAQYGPSISRTDPVPIEGSHPNAPDPAGVAKVASVERLRKTNMYFGAIGFIYDVKTGPFWEHSPTLYDISGVKGGWGKINKGMIKMYNAEVLSKFPVVQHFRFGSLFSWDRDPNATPPSSSMHASAQPPSQTLKPSHMIVPGKQILDTASSAAPRSANPSVTAAPWAKTPSLGGATRSSFPEHARSRGALRQADGSRNPGANPERRPTDMPPPTKAPWAK